MINNRSTFNVQRSTLEDQRGVILIGALVTMIFFMVVSLAIIEFSTMTYSSSRRTLVALNALSAAEAGADSFMYNLNLTNNSNYQGTNNAPTNGSVTNSCTGYTSSPVTMVSNSVQGKMTYETCVQNGTIANEKIIFSTGKIYLPITATTPTVIRKVKVVTTATSSGGYAVQTGNGGLTLSNSAAINGSVYLNGRLLMSNSASVGTSASPATLSVAGYGCGSGASYPSLCSGATGQSDLPIYLSNSSHIYGNVHAPNMTGSNSDAVSTRAAMTNSGLVDAIAPPVAMPDNERSTVMGRTTFNNASASSADCPSHQGTTTWNSGSHFTGSVNIDKSCIVTVKGDVWIDGGLTLSNSGTLIPDTGLTSPPVIMIDGQSGFQPSNSSALQTNLGGIGFHINTYWSAAGACSTTCPTPTGADLLTSTNTNTIQFSNQFTGAGSQFYAVWSGLAVSNSTTVGALIGQKVSLSNTGFITIGQASSGASGTWNVKYWEQVF